MIVYCADVYTGGSVLCKTFDSLGDLLGYIFEFDDLPYDNINIYKHEKNVDPYPIDFTGNRVDL